MKRALLVVCICVFSINLYAQTEKKNIEATIEAFFNGLSLINPDTLKFYTTSDFHLLEDGEIWTLDTLINKIMPRKDVNLQRVNTFEFIRTEQNKNIAWVSYHNSAELRVGEKHRSIKWLESAVLIKEESGWKIQMLHSTKLK